MRKSTSLSAAALALAASSVSLHAQTVISTFTENYDDLAAASRWTFQARESGVDPAAATPDATVNFAFDYSATKFESNLGPTGQFAVPVGAAPGGGGNIGVQIHVNDGQPAVTATAQAVIMPTGINVGTEFIMKTDVFLNYNAPAQGSGSTESMVIGLNADGIGVAGDNLGTLPVNQSANGYAFYASSDGDNAGDYRVYARKIPGDDGPNYSKLNAAWTGTSRQFFIDGTGQYTGTTVGPGEANGAPANGGTIPYRGFNNANTYYRDELFPNSQGYEVAGAIGKHWVTAQIEQHGKIALYTLNGKIINHLFLPSGTSLAGKPELGLSDLTAGQPDDPTDSYVIYDNTSITTLNAATPNAIAPGSTYVTFNAGGTVTANGAATVNGITIDTTPTTLAGTGTLQLGTTSVGNGDYGAIWSGDGAQVIAKPLSIQADSAIYVDKAADTLTLTSVTVNPSIDLNKVGAGTLRMPGGFAAKSITVQRVGKLAFSGTGGTKTSYLALEGQPGFTGGVPATPLSTTLSTLDFGRTVVAWDYPANASVAISGTLQPLSPLTLVQAYLNNGYAADGNNNPQWNGAGLVTSAPEVQGTLFTDPTSIYTVRVAEASSLNYANGATWLGKTIDATTVLFGFTFKADTDLDQDVDFGDLLTLAKNYNQTTDPTTGLAFAKGDADSNGKVEFADLLALAKNYNKTIGSSFPGASAAEFQADWALAQSLVPEPASLSAMLGLGALAMRRRRGH